MLTSVIMMDVYMLTRNKYKLLAAKSVFNRSGITLKILDVDYPEIQADTSVEIAKHTALAAAYDHNYIVIREDHSTYFNALLGFPGPYGNYFERHISPENLLDLMKGKKDRRGYFELGAVIAWPDGKFKEYVHRVPFAVSKKCSKKGKGWDKVLMHPNDTRTFGEYGEQGSVGNDASVWNKNFLNIIKDLQVKDLKTGKK